MSENCQIDSSLPMSVPALSHDKVPLSHDHSVTPITTMKLNGTNYLTCSQSARWSILSRGKWWHIIGSTRAPAPALSDPHFPK